MGVFQIVVTVMGVFVRSRTDLALENLALRQQLALLQQKSKRRHLRKRDRIFWVFLSRIWSNWRSVLVIVQPDTVVRWHQRGFKRIQTVLAMEVEGKTGTPKD